MLKDPKYQEAFVMVVAMTVDIVDFDKIFDNKTGSGSGEISDTTATVQRMLLQPPHTSTSYPTAAKVR